MKVFWQFYVFCCFCILSSPASRRITALLSDIQIQPFQLEIISVIPFNISVGVALPWTGAALQLAFESVREEFSSDLNISLTSLYDKDDRTCEETDAHAPVLLADYYNTKAANHCATVIATGKQADLSASKVLRKKSPGKK
jgi:hypothetical protein